MNNTKAITFRIAILYLLSIVSHPINAQTSIFELLESQTRNDIRFRFTMPSFTVDDTTFYPEYNIPQLFSHINLTEDDNNVWILESTDSIGFPQLPFFILNLKVPNNAENFFVNISSATTDETTLPYQVAPCQSLLENDTSNHSFRMDTTFYNSNNVFPSRGITTEEFVLFGEKGLSIALYPFLYSPSNNKITILETANITVSFTRSATNASSGHRESPSANVYLGDFFFNYQPNDRTTVNDSYLIITHPSFEESINYFADYKQNIGYEVSVVNTYTTGSTANMIKAYIQNMYNNTDTRPDYVLLVGDTNHIPASAGLYGNDDNPITDIEYSLLEGSDGLSDIFIGRFSVQNTNELQNVINKTIYMETNIGYYDKLAFLASGYGSNLFKKVQEKTKNRLLQHNYTCATVYEEDGGTLSAISNQLNQDNTLFVYRGHGSINSLAFNYYGIDTSYINNMSSHTFPICLSIACLSGNYASNVCWGEKWIRSENGGTAFFGATVPTYRILNNIMQNKILKKYDDNHSLSTWINAGLRRFYTSSSKRKKHIRAYNLLGDPSLKLAGVNCLNNIIVKNPINLNNGRNMHLSVENTIQNNNSFVINASSSVFFTAGNEIYLTNGFYAATGSLFTAEIAPCGNQTRGEQGMGKNEEATETTSEFLPKTQQAKVSQFVLYPNPTTGMVQINTDKAICKVEIYNLLGATVLEKANPQSNTLDVSSLPAGAYIVRVATTDGKQRFGKLVKK